MEYDFSKEAERQEVQYDFSELPEEIQRLYLLKLPVPDIANYCAVNPSVHKICADDYFWLLKVDHDFHVYEYKPKDITYQQQFLDLLRITNPNEAAKEGRLDILIYLDSQGQLPDRGGNSDAAFYGHLDVLKWLKTKGIYHIEDIIRGASWAGYINILEWLGSDGIPYYRDGANSAVAGGHINVLEWFEARGILPTNNNGAASHGQINVLNWLEQRRILPNVNGANWAARAGHIKALEWLEQRGILPNVNGANMVIDDINNNMINWNKSKRLGLRADGSPLDVLDWLYSRGIYPDINGVYVAVQKENIKMLNWLEDHAFIIFPNTKLSDIQIKNAQSKHRLLLHPLDGDEIKNILQSAATYGHVNIFEWLEQRGINATQDTANTAAANNNIDVLEWLAVRGIFPTI